MRKISSPVETFIGAAAALDGRCHFLELTAPIKFNIAFVRSAFPLLSLTVAHRPSTSVQQQKVHLKEQRRALPWPTDHCAFSPAECVVVGKSFPAPAIPAATVSHTGRRSGIEGGIRELPNRSIDGTIW